MAKTERVLGPAQAWMDRVPNSELMTLFTDKFFGGNRRLKSAFKLGRYRVGARVAIAMVRWWASFGVRIRLHEIRPDYYGEADTGPLSSSKMFDKQAMDD